MVENAFKQALKKSGVLEAVPSFDRNGHYYTVIKVTTKEIADKFISEASKLGIKVKASLYEEGMDIWVFKAYNT